jgi:hypothetical protein
VATEIDFLRAAAGVGLYRLDKVRINNGNKCILKKKKRMVRLFLSLTN